MHIFFEKCMGYCVISYFCILFIYIERCNLFYGSIYWLVVYYLRKK